MIISEKNTASRGVISISQKKIEYDSRTGKYFASSSIDTFVTLGLKVTSKCNLGCIHCCAKDANVTELSLENACKIIDRIAESEVVRVYLTGGEPLRYQHLLPILRRLSKHGLSTAISTNLAISLDTDAYQLSELASLVDNIKTSILGTEQTHDLITGRSGSYAQTLQNLRYFISRGVPIFVQTSVLKENQDQLMRIARECEFLGITKLTYYSLINQGRAIRIFQERQNVRPESIEDIYYRICHTKERESWSLSIDLVIWHNDGRYTMVLQDGSLTANPIINPPQNSFLVGNLLSETVQQLWVKYPFKKQHLNYYLRGVGSIEQYK